MGTKERKKMLKLLQNQSMFVSMSVYKEINYDLDFSSRSLQKERERKKGHKNCSVYAFGVYGNKLEKNSNFPKIHRYAK